MSKQSATTSTITNSSSDIQSIHSLHSQVFKELLAGGIAGCIAKSVTAPLDRVKILYQGANPNVNIFIKRWLGPFHAVNWIIREEGFRAAYKGHAVTLIRIFPYAALNYSCYEQYKILLIPQNEQEITPLRHLLAGSLAGMTSVFFTYPLDYVHSRITYQVKISRYRGIVQTIQSTLQEGVETAKAVQIQNQLQQQVLNSSSGAVSSNISNAAKLPFPDWIYGVRALYRGFGPTVMGIIPYAGVSFATYDTLKKTLQNRSQDGHINIFTRLACGAFAGIAAQTASYPLDVIRRRMQLYGLSSALPYYRHTWHAVKDIICKEGLRGLYIGLSINYIKVGPAHAVSFVTYEFMKEKLGLTKSKH